MFGFLKEKLKKFIESARHPKGKEEESAKAEVQEKNKEKLEYITEEAGEKADKKPRKKQKPEVKEIKIEKPVEEAIEEKLAEETKKQSEEKVGFFAKIKSRFSTTRFDQETFNELFEKLEALLLENNVSLEVVDKIRADMEKRLVNIEIEKSKIEQEIKNSLKETLLEILIEPFYITEKIKENGGTFVMLFFGINGSGKTTSIAKIASLLQENKISCVIAAGDTFRAASIEQLKKHGDKLGIKIIHQNYGSDPAAVAFDAIKYAEAHGIKAVLIDTAGRMHTKDNLMKEMEKIIRVAKPDIKIFVGESITGNDATEQARQFNSSFGVDAIILTKADVDEKGGTAISVGYITGKPILFLGTGQDYHSLEKFHPNEIIANLGLE